jgi:PBP1b-binding outer membrane lipoprotein LpoB
MKRLLQALTITLLLTGCSLIPKKVELFQDKVHRFPTPSAKQVELQRETAQRAADSAAQTLHSALVEGATTNVVASATDTEKLTVAIAESVGAPEKTNGKTTDNLIQSLRAQEAKTDGKIDAFIKKNDENANKKIEGTGLVQVPYFAWTGGILVVLLVGWYILRTVAGAAALANPGAAVGVGALNVAGNVVSKGFQQLVKGGEAFKDWVGKEISDPILKQKIVDTFNTLHKTAQDADVKTVVDHLIK